MPVATDEPSRFAVMILGGTQYKVAPGDLISVERLPYQVGQTVHNKSVLLVGSRDGTIVGKPMVADAHVEFTVEEHPKANKVIVFKKKAKKGYQRWRGYRAALTLVRVGVIETNLEHDQVLDRSLAVAELAVAELAVTDSS